MLRHPPLVFLLLLSACARPDTLPPEVGLLEPQGGGVAQGREVAAQGYAFDPSGVVSVRVNGKEVLPEGERGRRLVRFAFRLKAPTSGRVELRLEAWDPWGNRAERTLTFALDDTPPRILVERIQRQGDGYLVYGRIEDNTGLDRASLRVGERYLPLSLPKGRSVPFAVEAPRGAYLIAVDSAGNRSSRRLP